MVARANATTTSAVSRRKCEFTTRQPKKPALNTRTSSQRFVDVTLKRREHQSVEQRRREYTIEETIDVKTKPLMPLEGCLSSDEIRF
ncbi:unnamed protein product [Enterobius vermicularis]|uniref:Uncharacterized protein n=1 Tax=Enterobius vermicularis TaxID=51028 RepID=A0A0N4USW1_ENTVE|nr:unnamed protein product [Enterobius vermicularis]